jgi:hypothetical protein
LTEITPRKLFPACPLAHEEFQMRKGKTALKLSNKSSAKSARKNSAKKKYVTKDVFTFRWLKKAMVGKSREESLDLLDRWILKKRALGLFS